MLPPDLQDRKRELQRALNSISGSHEVVIAKQLQTEEGDVVVEFQSTTRLRPTSMQIWIWEQFRDIDLEPRLYAFKYQLTDPQDLRTPVFRYECHPDTVDPTEEQVADVAPFHSPYGFEPHFHPDRTGIEHIRKLHFPFHRSERRAVVFSLLQWIRVDLIRRFYEPAG